MPSSPFSHTALGVYRCKCFIPDMLLYCVFWHMESVLMVRMNLNLTQKHMLTLEL